jgi:outer membrane protein W
MSLAKKIVLVIACMGGLKADAQEFYIKAGIGYAFPMPGEAKDAPGNIVNGYRSNNLAGQYDYLVKTASFSSGLQLLPGVGYMFSDNIGVEVNAAANIAPKQYSFTDVNTTSKSRYADVTLRNKANGMIALMPSLVLQTRPGNWNVYMRAGLVLPVNTGMEMHATYSYHDNGDINENYWNVKNYFAVGLTAATGVKYKLADRLTAWAEVSTMYLSLLIEEADLTGVTMNGTSYDLSKVKGSKTILFNKNGVTDPNHNQQTYSQPFSNLGAGLGIAYSLSNHAKTTNKKK